MRDLSSVPHFPVAEKLVQAICKKTQNNDPIFFRVLVAYHLTKIASMMRTNIGTPDRGIIPVNMYAINLGNSGLGKGYATNLMEDQVTHKFRRKFLEETFPAISEAHLHKLAARKSLKQNTNQDEEEEKIQKEFRDLGPLLFSFDSATTAAVKQARHKLLMANAGSMCFECDEIGSNLLGQMDVLTTFLELFDMGKIKQKLVKHTKDNMRNEDIDGKTPTNMLLYGTPSKLLNGAKTEEEFISLLDTGYARRCFFGLSRKLNSGPTLTPAEVMAILTDPADDIMMAEVAKELQALADPVNFNRKIRVPDDVGLVLMEYRIACDQLAQKMPEHKEIQKAELQHRHSKALKLAGTYAFIAGSAEISEEILLQAIKLAEESGEAFNQILNREKPYEKLAKYIASEGRELTHVDLTEDLPFYKGTDANKRTLLDMATAYGYRNNIIIKRHYYEGIEFLKGESLEKTNLNKLTVSYSTQLADNYKNDIAKWDDLHKLTQAQGFHWVNHHLLPNK